MPSEDFFLNLPLASVHLPLSTKGRSLSPDPAGVDYTDTTNDGLGRAWKVSNPHRSGALPSDGTTQYTYDAIGRVTNIQRPDGNNVVTSYSANCATMTDEAGKARQSCSDGLGRVTQVTEDPGGLGYVTTYAYNALDDLTDVYQGSQHRQFLYDSLSRLTSATNPESGTTAYSYDANGNVLARTDARNITTTYSYDALNRLTSKSYNDTPQTPTANFYYDETSVSIGSWTSPPLTNTKGRLTHTTAGSGATLSETANRYDPAGRVNWFFQCMPYYCASPTLVSALQGSNSFDLAGDLTTYASPSGFTFTNTVNSAQQTTLMQSNYVGPNYPQNLGSFTYTPFGSLATVTDGCTPAGSCTSAVENYTYNNRLQPVVVKLTSPAVNNCAVYNYYSGLGNASSCTTPSQASSGNNGNAIGYYFSDPNFGHSATFEYDSLNRLQTAVAATVPVVDFGFEDGTSGWVAGFWGCNSTVTTSQAHSGGASLAQTGSVTGGSYQDLGGLVAGNTYQVSVWIKASAGTTAQAELWVHDTAGGNSINTSYFTPGTSWQQVSLTFTADSTNAMRIHLVYQAGSGTIYYDDVNVRPTSGSAANYDWTYNYDPWGNMQCSGWTNGVDTCAAVTYNTGSNRLSAIGTQTPQYDAAGNMLQDGTGTGSHSYTWDAEGRLTTIASPSGGPVIATYNYNALGQRVQATGSAVGAYPVFQVYDAFGNLTYHGDTVTWGYVPFSPVAGKVYGEYYGLPLFIHTNALGSTGTTTRPDGTWVSSEIYDPWGQRWGTAGTLLDERYASINNERDAESGLDYTPNRMYNSQYGRWLSPDPAGTKAVTLTDPQTWNMYAYVRNNPTTLTDPTGLVAAPSGCGRAGVDCKQQAPVVQQFKKAYNEWRKIIAAHPNVAAAIQIGIALATRGESEEGAGGEVETPSGGTATRYMGKGEADVATKTGEIPNVDAQGNPKQIHFTTDEPMNSASEAKSTYELGDTPTHRATVSADRINGVEPAPGGPVTSGGGSQAVTRNPIPVKPDEIIPLSPQ